MLLASENGVCKFDDHDFRETGDGTSLFCRKCAQQRDRVPAAGQATLEAILERLNTLPPYLPCPGPHWYPYYVYPTFPAVPAPYTVGTMPYNPTWTWTTSSSDVSGSISSGSVVNG